MSSVKQVFVDCLHDGRVIASYEFGYGETQGPSLPPSHQFSSQRPNNLAKQGVAFPPYAAIGF
jgi:hypothetical protein